MGKILVKHIASKDDWGVPKDGSTSWLEYWEKHSKKYAFFCCDCGKTCPSTKDIVGAHVQKVNSHDKSVYIVPTCNACNVRGAHDNHSFRVEEGDLVPANKDNL